jgi:hypothetical protein
MFFNASSMSKSIYHSSFKRENSKSITTSYPHDVAGTLKFGNIFELLGGDVLKWIL